LTPLIYDKQSASQTGKQVDRVVRGGSTGLGQLSQTARQSDIQSNSQTGRQSARPARGGSIAPRAVQPVWVGVLLKWLVFELRL
jgi:hypothetical protein